MFWEGFFSGLALALVPSLVIFIVLVYLAKEQPYDGRD